MPTNIDSNQINGKREVEALNAIVNAIHELDSETQSRILATVRTFLGLPHERIDKTNYNLNQKPNRPSTVDAGAEDRHKGVPFSKEVSISAKEFMREKQPKTDVERMACLAYYLTHYEGMAYFKTLDLSRLNTEAAQPKFANAANAASNALKYRYFAHSPKSGFKQLSAPGEEFVRALPDRESARAAMTRSRPRRKPKKNVKNKSIHQRPPLNLGQQT